MIDFAQIAAIFGAFSAIGTFCVAAWKFFIKPSFKWIKNIARAIESIDKIQSELKPNGGTSMRDAVNRIEIRLTLEQHARRATSSLLDVGIFETDSKGLCQWTNRKYADITGLTINEASGFGWINSVHYDDRECVVEEWTKAISQKRAFNSSFRFVKSNPFDNSQESEITRVIVYAVPATNNSGELIGYIGIVSTSEG